MRGGYLGNLFFVLVVRHLGLWFAYAWLTLIAGWFTIASPASFRHSARFLERVLGPIPFWRKPFLVFRHFYSFGVTLLDRLAVIEGTSLFECNHEGEELLLGHLEKGQGIILVGAHLGSWEIGGHFLGRHGAPINVVVLDKEAERMRSLFSKAMENRLFRLISTDGSATRSIPIASALRRGEAVALLGDRPFGGRELSVRFLGGSARFPVGPFLLAAATGAPLFQVFAVRERMGCYRFFTFPEQRLTKEEARGGDEALRPHVEQFARRLEETARRYPLQWFNIYSYWDEEDGPGEKKSGAGSGEAESSRAIKAAGQ